MKKKFLDRNNARRVKMTGMQQICIDLKPGRSVSDVYINQKMDVTELVKFVEKEKEAGKDITFFYTFMAALGMLFYNRPYLNRFISNRHMFEHNDVVLSFVAKVAFDDNARERMVLIKIDPNDNLESISKKIQAELDSFRGKSKSKTSGANNAVEFLGKLPNIIRIPIMGIFKWCDKKGILPASLVSDNLYYSSMIVSNLGSIHCGAIFHNITDFGTSSSLATMGEIRDEDVYINGKKQQRKLCEFGVNLDERIADGYYFAKSLQMLQYILAHPELLMGAVSEKIEID